MTKISVQKGSMSLLTVLIAYSVACGASAIAAATGIDIPVIQRDQAVVAITAGLSGLITGGLNWLKHRKDVPPIAIPKA